MAPSTSTDQRPPVFRLSPILDPSSGQVLDPDGLLDGTSDQRVGTITRISRFSTQDGPGIRTTVFVKGCPLRCEWCSNPETWIKVPQIAHKDRSCTRCEDTGHYRCVQACPVAAPTSSGKAVSILTWEKEDGSGLAGGPRIDRDACTKCGLCVEACPFGAIFWYGWHSTADQLMDLVRSDVKYYEKSGGGLTISGGEPLMQPDFVGEVFGKAQSEGIHTCLDTSGSATADQLMRVLPYTDLFHYDLKVMDDGLHQRWTKASNVRIHDNLRLIADHGKRIIIRVPMIPGVIDTDDNLDAIAAMAADLDTREAKAGGPQVEVELLPYHRGGVAKFYELDQEYTLEPLRTQPEDELRRMVARVRAFGVHARVEGKDY